MLDLDSDLLSIERLHDGVAKKHYEGDFHDHLNRLVSIDLAANRAYDNVSQTRYDMARYLGLQQTAFEKASSVERKSESEVDWDLLDTRVERWRAKLGSLLGTENRSEALAPIRLFTVDCLENCMIYDQMFPGSGSNPWAPTARIIKSGLMLYVSDDREKLTDYRKGIYDAIQQDCYGNLGVIVKGRGKQLGGFVLDRRYQAQMLVHRYLTENAPGKDDAKSLKEIRHFLATKGLYYPEDRAQIELTTPLKKTGTIGSCIHGFFVIDTREDLVESYRFHRTKAESILRILRKYEERSGDFPGLDLPRESGFGDG